MFLICQSPWSDGAKRTPTVQRIIDIQELQRCALLLDKITDMLNEVEVNGAMFHSFLCCYKTNRHPGLQGDSVLFKHLHRPLRESPSNTAK